MNLNECINNVSTFLDLKRFANEYVIDYKRLSFDELKSATIKTAPQYSNRENVEKAVDSFELHPDRNIRILFRIFIFNILLNSDDFVENQHVCEEKIISYEKNIVDLANESSLKNEDESVDFYKFVVEAA